MDLSQRKTCLRTLVVAMAAAFGLAGGPQDSQARAGGTERPISGMCNTEVTPKSPPNVVPIVLAVDVKCQLAHLGLVVGGTDEQVVVPAGPPDGPMLPIIITVKTITYTAADGDKLRSTFGGQGVIDLVANRVTFTGVETFTGGTGRFRNATGTSMTTGEASLINNKGFLTISGAVSY